MSGRRLALVGSAGVALAALVGGVVWVNASIAPKGAGYYAKVLCSGVFVSGRPAAQVQGVDLGRFWYVQGGVDAQERTATASMFGLGQTTAVHRDGLGCTLARGTTAQALRQQAPDLPAPRPTRDLPWPTGDQGIPDIAPPPALQTALDQAFAEGTGSRAVVVVHGGELVAERYAPGFSADTPLLGWSMTKSVTSTLIGLAADQGHLDIADPAPVTAWSTASDPRSAITTDQLLRMSSGLAFSEVYGAFGDATHMLFVAPSAADYAAQSVLGAEPDSAWSYSSGTTNVLQRILRTSVGDEAYLAYPRRALFDPIGMHSAVIEPDAAGDFVGSSFMYATARDWARFGLLHLQDGTWQGERLLPEGWVEYATTPTPAAPRGEYGAQWWLNAGAPDDPADRRWPSVPVDAFDASGFEGQNVLVVPSRDVVIVRLGLSPDRENWDFDAFAGAVLDALPERPAVSARLDTELPDEAPLDRAAYAYLGEVPWDPEAASILPEDWAALVAERADLEPDPHGVRWTAHPSGRPVLLRLERGVIVATAPDRATVGLLLRIADPLDARVSGDQGTHFVQDSEAPGGVRAVR